MAMARTSPRPIQGWFATRGLALATVNLRGGITGKAEQGMD